MNARIILFALSSLSLFGCASDQAPANTTKSEAQTQPAVELVQETVPPAVACDTLVWQHNEEVSRQLKLARAKLEVYIQLDELVQAVFTGYEPAVLPSALNAIQFGTVRLVEPSDCSTGEDGTVTLDTFAPDGFSETVALHYGGTVHELVSIWLTRIADLSRAWGYFSSKLPQACDNPVYGQGRMDERERLRAAAKQLVLQPEVAESLTIGLVHLAESLVAAADGVDESADLQALKQAVVELMTVSDPVEVAALATHARLTDDYIENGGREAYYQACVRDNSASDACQQLLSELPAGLRPLPGAGASPNFYHGGLDGQAVLVRRSLQAGNDGGALLWRWRVCAVRVGAAAGIPPLQLKGWAHNLQVEGNSLPDTTAYKADYMAELARLASTL